ncbi:MAG: hypothetical protein QXG68_07050 [Candidatus Bathyarchaeia archaeon]
MEKGAAGRVLAFALGIICLILAAGLMAAIANYTSIISEKDKEIDSLKSQIMDRDNMVLSLNSTIENLLKEIESKDSQISSLRDEMDRIKVWLEGNITYYEAQISALENRVNELTAIVNLEKSVVLVEKATISQPARSYTSWGFPVDYAGYITVVVHSSTTPNTYVRVKYSAFGVDYDNTITVGTSGIAVFPVLPCSNVEVIVGNTNLLTGATQTITIIYTY